MEYSASSSDGLVSNQYKLTKREKAFNRYAGMKRVYGRDKKGKLSEVLYEAPPEDESTKGAPAHFMVKMVDGRETMSQQE